MHAPSRDSVSILGGNTTKNLQISQPTHQILRHREIPSNLQTHTIWNWNKYYNTTEKKKKES